MVGVKLATCHQIVVVELGMGRRVAKDECGDGLSSNQSWQHDGLIVARANGFEIPIKAMDHHGWSHGFKNLSKAMDHHGQSHGFENPNKAMDHQVTGASGFRNPNKVMDH